ncbi:DUF3618 domain-containing protein [Microvirga antarctica]|uniref:DUF3618 domain-containing protein n=1 Tax=Microvirga antarctica TaxID=2819233 RepID=UPI001B302EA4|nr:DUF3618 domain-containing protein [Microvirga antarctica]
MTDSLEDLQHEVEVSRARLDLTLDRLEEKLTVSGVVDDLLGTARRSKFAPLFDHVTETLRHNPVPVLLVAAGLGLLLHRLTPGSRRSQTRSQGMMDADLPIVPPEPRLYRAGATTLQSREDLEGHRRIITARL